MKLKLKLKLNSNLGCKTLEILLSLNSNGTRQKHKKMIRSYLYSVVHRLPDLCY